MAIIWVQIACTVLKPGFSVSWYYQIVKFHCRGFINQCTAIQTAFEYFSYSGYLTKLKKIIIAIVSMATCSAVIKWNIF